MDQPVDAIENVRFHAHLLDAVRQAVIATDIHGKIRYWNRAAETLYGWAAGEVLGRDILEVTPSQLSKQQAAEIMSCLQRGESWSGEFLVQRRDGTVFPAMVDDTPICNESGELMGVVGISSDITERKRVHEMLHRQALVFENTHDGIIVASLDGIITDWNRAAEKMFGYSKAEILGKRTALLHANNNPQVHGSIRESVARNCPWSGEVVYVKKDGSHGITRTTILPLCDETGKVVGRFGVNHDVTVQKHAEAELRESERRYRLLAEHATDMIARYSPEGICLYVSPACRTLIGYEPWELEGRTAHEFLHPDDADSLRKARQSVLELDSPVTVVHRVRRKSGETVWFETVGKALRNETTSSASEMICVSRDVSARKHAEEVAHRQQAELAHISRLHSLGELASGIAHELNQPLTAICHYADACAQAIQSGGGAIDSENLLAWTKKIAGQAERAGQIVHRMKAFVRKSDSSRDQVDLLEALREAVKLVETDARWRGVLVRFMSEADVLPVRVDRLQIQQVLVNLLRNAFDAMEETEPEQRVVTIHVAHVADEGAVVAVEDRGKGLAPEHVDHIFESFFTTKPQGLGVGLAISRSIIETHGGRLSVCNNPDRGVTFRFTLPVRLTGF